jgi:hypothetical protein
MHNSVLQGKLNKVHYFSRLMSNQCCQLGDFVAKSGEFLRLPSSKKQRQRLVANLAVFHRLPGDFLNYGPLEMICDKI